MAAKIAHDALAMIEYDNQPSVLLFADSAAGIERTRRAAALCGCRVSDSVGIEEAAERLDQQVRVDAVLVDVEHDAGAALDRLLDRLEIGAVHGRHGSVVSCAPELIDLVAARTAHGRVQHLSGAAEAELVAAVALAATRVPARLEDVRKRPQLQALSEEVGRIATILASLSEGAPSAEGDPMVRSAAATGERGGIDAGMVRAIIRARRLREQYFHPDLFADPAWDMLLDLMAARLEGSQVAVSSLCIAAAVPATTALRWIKTLTNHGLFVRIADPQDGRRVHIALSDEAAQGLEAYLVAAQRISPLLI